MQRRPIVRSVRPILHKRPRPISREKRPTSGIFGKILFILSLIGIGYLVFFSDFFIVKNIKVETQSEDGTLISSKIADTIKETTGKNLIFLNTKTLEDRISKSFPDLEKVQVLKSYPKTIRINFSKFPEAANIIYENASGKTSYIINTIGFAVKVDAENPNLPYIRLTRDEPINTEESIIEKTKLIYIIEAKKYFEDKFGMAIKELNYKPQARELHLLTEKDFYIWLDIQKDFESQFKKLKKALPKLDIFTENLEYIDLRIAGTAGDRIIYKRR